MRRADAAACARLRRSWLTRTFGCAQDEVQNDYEFIDPKADPHGLYKTKFKTCSVYTKEQRRKERAEFAGYLMVQNRKKRKEWKRRWAELSGRDLVFFRTREDAEARNRGDAVEPESSVKLNTLRKVQPVRMKDMEFAFEASAARAWRAMAVHGVTGGCSWI